MTLKGGTSQACAACKYQRRRCTSECPLAPYFPPDQPKLFQNAHKLFGVSNILKILKKLEPEQKATAMWSIMYQANERDRDPVHGCLGKICQLRYQIWHTEQELHSLHAQLDLYRQQQQQLPAPANAAPAQGLELVMAPPSSHVSPSEGCYGNVVGGGYANGSPDGNNVVANNPMWLQFPYGGTSNSGEAFDNGSLALQPQFVVAQQQQQPLDLPQEVVQDYDEMPFFDIMDDRQSYIDSKEAYDSRYNIRFFCLFVRSFFFSSFDYQLADIVLQNFNVRSSEESALKDTNQSIEHIVDNELKNAAACLSLTSVN